MLGMCTHICGCMHAPAEDNAHTYIHTHTDMQTHTCMHVRPADGRGERVLVDAQAVALLHHRAPLRMHIHKPSFQPFHLCARVRVCVSPCRACRFRVDTASDTASLQRVCPSERGRMYDIDTASLQAHPPRASRCCNKLPRVPCTPPLLPVNLPSHQRGRS